MCPDEPRKPLTGLAQSLKAPLRQLYPENAGGGDVGSEATFGGMGRFPERTFREKFPANFGWIQPDFSTAVSRS